MKLDIPLRLKCAGRYKISLRREDGSLRQETEWFDNLITNQGLDYIGTGGTDYNLAFSSNSFLTRCAVGTSSATPAFTDTTLGAQLAAQPPYGTVGDITAYSPSYVAGPPAYLTASHTYTYTLGAVVGNITEVGVGIYPVGSVSTDPIAVFSHALIMSGGSPTTISVTSADQLEVTFELRWYVDTTLNPYTVTISGTGYSGDSLSLTTALSTAFVLASSIDANAPGNNTTRCYVYNGSIGTVTTAPSGTSADLGQAPIPSYTTGTYTKSYTYSANTTTGNLSGGITAIAIQTTKQCWQFSISPALAKDSTKTMTLTFAVSWARYP
jgi:hypothetical protein